MIRALLLLLLVGCSSTPQPSPQAAKDAAIFGCGLVRDSDPVEVAKVTGVPEDRVIQLQELCVIADRLAAGAPNVQH